MSTEFNNNINLGSVHRSSASKHIEKDDIVIAQQEEKDSLNNSFPVGQSALAGKSQIKADNIARDLALFKSNPHLVKVSDKFFDEAYERLLASNDPQAYEKACLLTSAFVNECVK